MEGRQTQAVRGASKDEAAVSASPSSTRRESQHHPPRALSPPSGPCHGVCFLVCTPLPLRPWPAGGYVHSLSIVLALSREICSQGRLTQRSREWVNDPGVALASAPHRPWQTRLLRPPEASRGADVHPGVSERDRPCCLLPKIRLDAGSHHLVHRCLYFDHLRPQGGASLVVQWLRSYLAMQGRWV